MTFISGNLIRKRNGGTRNRTWDLHRIKNLGYQIGIGHEGGVDDDGHTPGIEELNGIHTGMGPCFDVLHRELHSEHLPTIEHHSLKLLMGTEAFTWK